MMSKAVGIVCVLAASAEAFSPLAAGPALRTRAAPAVCSLSATATSDSLSRRSVLTSAVFAAAVLTAPFQVFAEEADPAAAPTTTLPTVPTTAPAAAPVPEADIYKISGDYKADVSSLLAKMKAATMVKRGEPDIKVTVESARDEMNRFTAYYRRNNKVAGAASFSTLYTAISTLSGHFQNYGPEYPVPAKRQKRLLQQYAEIEKQISRGR